MIKKETWSMVIGISIIPAVWAVIANHIGVTIAAVSMISACPYVLAGKNAKDAVAMTLGLFLGIVWARLTFVLMGALTFNPDLVTFLVLAFMVAILIIIDSFIPKIVDCVAWLCGFAIAITVLGSCTPDVLNTMSLHLVLAMAVGVWCVGYVGSLIIGACNKAFSKTCKQEQE